MSWNDLQEGEAEDLNKTIWAAACVANIISHSERDTVYQDLLNRINTRMTGWNEIRDALYNLTGIFLSLYSENKRRDRTGELEMATDLRDIIKIADGLEPAEMQTHVDNFGEAATGADTINQAEKTRLLGLATAHLYCAAMVAFWGAKRANHMGVSN